MGRNAHFQNEDFIKAVLTIAAEHGPAAVTITAVAEAVGAPVGSVYHRFPSRDVLMAEVWLRVVASFQEDYLAFLEKGDGLGAALHTPRWVRRYPVEARILLMYRREELVAGDGPESLKFEVQEIARRLSDGVVAFAARTFGRTGREEVGRIVFATIDAPYAAVLRYIRLGKKPPRAVEDYLTKTYDAIIGGSYEDIQ